MNRINSDYATIVRIRSWQSDNGAFCMCPFLRDLLTHTLGSLSLYLVEVVSSSGLSCPVPEASFFVMFSVLVT